MRIKTIVIVAITILLTVVIMQNTGTMWFKFLWMTFLVSKLFMLLLVAIVAFIIGYLAGRPKRRFNLSGEPAGTNQTEEKTNTLSEDDRDYIS